MNYHAIVVLNFDAEMIILNYGMPFYMMQNIQIPNMFYQIYII